MTSLNLRRNRNPNRSLSPNLNRNPSRIKA